jgi:hypothetical protein
MADYEPSSAKDVHAVQRYTQRGAFRDKGASLLTLDGPARYDEATLYKILDEGTVAHVGFTLPHEEDGLVKDDWPHPVIPMAYGRIDDVIYLHGYINSRLLKALSTEDVKCCITVRSVPLAALWHRLMASIALCKATCKSPQAAKVQLRPGGMLFRQPRTAALLNHI